MLFVWTFLLWHLHHCFFGSKYATALSFIACYLLSKHISRPSSREKSYSQFFVCSLSSCQYQILVDVHQLATSLRFASDSVIFQLIDYILPWFRNLDTSTNLNYLCSLVSSLYFNCFLHFFSPFLISISILFTRSYSIICFYRASCDATCPETFTYY